MESRPRITVHVSSTHRISHGVKTSHHSPCLTKRLPSSESSVGPTTQTKRQKKPVQVIFTIVLLETIVTQTNLMAEKRGVNLVSARSYRHSSG